MNPVTARPTVKAMAPARTAAMTTVDAEALLSSGIDKEYTACPQARPRQSGIIDQGTTGSCARGPVGDEPTAQAQHRGSARDTDRGTGLGCYGASGQDDGLNGIAGSAWSVRGGELPKSFTEFEFDFAPGLESAFKQLGCALLGCVGPQETLE